MGNALQISLYEGLLCLFIDILIKVSFTVRLKNRDANIHIPSEKFLPKLISLRDLIFNIFSSFFSKFFPHPTIMISTLIYYDRGQ